MGCGLVHPGSTPGCREPSSSVRTQVPVKEEITIKSSKHSKNLVHNTTIADGKLADDIHTETGD
jgi:hypothetical protein